MHVHAEDVERIFGITMQPNPQPPSHTTWSTGGLMFGAWQNLRIIHSIEFDKQHGVSDSDEDEEGEGAHHESRVRVDSMSLSCR